MILFLKIQGKFMIRPLFSSAWVASQRIYDASNPEAKVAKIIGGKMAENITAPGSQWANTCAVRMSYILNQSGVIIPFEYNKTVSGADKRWYFHYVRDLISFLGKRWGKPDIIASYPPGNKGDLTGKKA